MVVRKFTEKSRFKNFLILPLGSTDRALSTLDYNILGAIFTKCKMIATGVNHVSLFI